MDDNLAVLLFLIHLLQSFQAFKLHHEVKLFLLLDPVTLECLVFFELFVADVQDFGLKDKLVEAFYIVVFFVKLV